MENLKVIWPRPIIQKLRSFRSEHFTFYETHDYILGLISEAEDLLLNPVLGRTYIEEFGKHKGLSRIVIRKFKIYFKRTGSHIIIAAVCFPGEK